MAFTHQVIFRKGIASRVASRRSPNHIKVEIVSGRKTGHKRSQREIYPNCEFSLKNTMHSA
jgi:hypothetical protein